MKRFYVDASVFFPAAHSSRGSARELVVLAAAEQPEAQLVVSDDVIEETRRNLAYDAPEKLLVFERLVATVPFEVMTVTRRAVRAAARVVVAKDAPVVAAAKKARVDALVTYDRKYLLGKPEVAKYIRAKVITPDEAVRLLRGKPPHRP